MINWTCPFFLALVKLCVCVIADAKTCCRHHHEYQVDFDTCDLNAEELIIADKIVIIDRALLIIVQDLISFCHMCEILQTLRSFIRVVFTGLLQISSLNVLLVRV